MEPKTITAEEFDQRFDAGEDILDYCDLDQIQRPGLVVESVQIELPHWILEALDREAQRLKIPKEDIIKAWVLERFDAA
ncbi:MAG: CopG family transcriptional regulator [Synechococcus sp.]|nr:CopG family transcriptional regulator [Synechococcus sp.]